MALTLDGDGVAFDDDRLGRCAAVRHDEDIEAAFVIPPSHRDIAAQKKLTHLKQNKHNRVWNTPPGVQKQPQNALREQGPLNAR